MSFTDDAHNSLSSVAHFYPSSNALAKGGISLSYLQYVIYKQPQHRTFDLDSYQVNVLQLLTAFLKQNFLSLVQCVDVFEELVLLIHDFAFSGRRFDCRIPNVKRSITVFSLILKKWIPRCQNVFQF